MSQPITTIADEWRRYRDIMYPQGVSAAQNKECHQAFMAGALQAFCLVQLISNLPEPEAFTELDKVQTELVHFTLARVLELTPKG